MSEGPFIPLENHLKECLSYEDQSATFSSAQLLERCPLVILLNTQCQLMTSFFPEGKRISVFKRISLKLFLGGCMQG